MAAKATQIVLPRPAVWPVKARQETVDPKKKTKSIVKEQDPQEGYSAKHPLYKAFIECRYTGVAPRYRATLKRLFVSPVEVDVLARGDFGDRWVLADRSPDLSLELARRNIIAKEGVVCPLLASWSSHPLDVHLQQ